jgi:hypothetical protein
VWVMRFGAFKVSLNGSGVASLQLGEDLRIGYAIEGVVDLDGVEALRVVGEHLCRSELFRIEGAPPFGIVVAGSAHPHRHAPIVRQTPARVKPRGLPSVPEPRQ